MVFVKDVDGVFDEDPRKNPKAKLIKSITATDLLKRNLRDMPIEREVLRCLENSRRLTSVRVINGLEPKQLRDYLKGKEVGTHIMNGRYEG
jgi:uridylate kinase